MHSAIRFSKVARPVAVAVLAVVASTLGCGTDAPSVKDTGDPGARTPPPTEQEVRESHRALIRAYESGDVDAFLDLLLPSADLLIFHPMMEDRFNGIEQVRGEIDRMFERLGNASWTEVHPTLFVEGDVAWLTSHVLVESPKIEHKFVGRGTEVWIRRDGQWRLVHGHWSEHPAIYAD